jgi:Tol biopolymer transport system component
VYTGKYAGNYLLHIRTKNADGTGGDSITAGAAGVSDREPAWSPDGKKIAFVRQRDSYKEEIYTMNANGTCVVRLTKNPLRDDEPAWSPDGKKIAFSSNRPYRLDIYTMNTDGTGLVPFTKGPNSANTQPAWQRLPGLPPPPSYGPCNPPVAPPG